MKQQSDMTLRETVRRRGLLSVYVDSSVTTVIITVINFGVL
jgi:hypothetical protein